MQYSSDCQLRITDPVVLKQVEKILLTTQHATSNQTKTNLPTPNVIFHTRSLGDQPQQVKAFSSILSLHSEVFNTMCVAVSPRIQQSNRRDHSLHLLSNDNSSSTSSAINLAFTSTDNLARDDSPHLDEIFEFHLDEPCDLIQNAIDFMYGMPVRLPFEQHLRLAHFGLRYKVRTLIHDCVRMFKRAKEIPSSILISALEFARCANSFKLQEKCLSQIEAQADQVFSSANISAFYSLEEEVAKLIIDRQLDVANEMTIFDAIIQWGKHQLELKSAQQNSIEDLKASTDSFSSSFFNSSSLSASSFFNNCSFSSQSMILRSPLANIINNNSNSNCHNSPKRKRSSFMDDPKQYQQQLKLTIIHLISSVRFERISADDLVNKVIPSGVVPGHFFSHLLLPNNILPARASNNNKHYDNNNNNNNGCSSHRCKKKNASSKRLNTYSTSYSGSWTVITVPDESSTSTSTSTSSLSSANNNDNHNNNNVHFSLSQQRFSLAPIVNTNDNSSYSSANSTVSGDCLRCSSESNAGSESCGGNPDEEPASPTNPLLPPFSFLSLASPSSSQSSSFDDIFSAFQQNGENKKNDITIRANDERMRIFELVSNISQNVPTFAKPKLDILDKFLDCDFLDGQVCVKSH